MALYFKNITFHFLCASHFSTIENARPIQMQSINVPASCDFSFVEGLDKRCSRLLADLTSRGRTFRECHVPRAKARAWKDMIGHRAPVARRLAEDAMVSSDRPRDESIRKLRTHEIEIA